MYTCTCTLMCSPSLNHAHNRTYEHNRVCVHNCACAHSHTYAYNHAYAHSCTCGHSHANTNLCTCANNHTHLCMAACSESYLHTHTHAVTCMHTHSCTNVHACALTLLHALAYPRNLLRTQAAAQSFGHSIESRTALYKQFVRPVLAYASSIWQPDLAQSHMQVMQRTQNFALRIATDCTRSTPTAHLHAETRVLPLKDYLELRGTQIFLLEGQRTPGYIRIL